MHTDDVPGIIEPVIASFALDQSKDPHAVRDLLISLNTANGEVRRAVGLAMAKLKDPQTVKPLMAAVNDTDANVRRTAAAVAATVMSQCANDLNRPPCHEIINSRAVESLLLALKDQDNEVRRNAALALGNSKDPRVLRALIAELKNPDAGIPVGCRNGVPGRS